MRCVRVHDRRLRRAHRPGGAASTAQQAVATVDNGTGQGFWREKLAAENGLIGRQLGGDPDFAVGQVITMAGERQHAGQVAVRLRVCSASPASLKASSPESGSTSRPSVTPAIEDR